MAALISAQTIANWSVFAASAAELVVESMVKYGYEVFNFKLRPKLIRAEILECNWDHWFARLGEDREYGGVFLYSAATGTINPVICIGLRGSVELPDVCSDDGRHVITIHSHPRCESPERAMPSNADWWGGAGKGWHIVVSYWGIFAHYAAGKQRGIVKWEEQQLLFIPRCEITGTGDIGRDLFLENRV